MIWNSPVWKDGLKKELRSFEKYLKDISLDKYDVNHFTYGLEKFYFVCAFIIRKLKENTKLSDELESTPFLCQKYLRTKKDIKIDFINFAEFYDLENPEDCSISINQVCNMLIHSFIFYPVFDEKKGMRFSGIFVNSDFTTDKCIYFFEFEKFKSLVQEVVKDEIMSITYNRKAEKIKKTRDIDNNEYDG